jgi:exosortase/archaeosortase family protein
MSDQAGHDEPNRNGRKPRSLWVMLRFFLVFVIIVLTLLIGYRYAIQTFANDWYLFQVARHTAMTLDLIGVSGELEGDLVEGPLAQRRRAMLAAWDAGRNTAAPEEVEAASTDPLTPWESFRYRIGSTLDLHDPRHVRAQIEAWADGRDKPSQEEIDAASDTPLSFVERYRYRRDHSRLARRTTGPRVWFVYNDGLEIQLRNLTTELQRVRGDASIGMEERPALLARMEEELDGLRAAIAAERAKDQPDYQVLGRFFVFIIVPECGAIEVMAIFLAAVVAFPTRWRKKLAGLLAGLPVMYGVNVLRLSFLAVVGALDTSRDRWIFNFAHEYLWQTVYIAFVVVVWLLWIEFVVRGRARDEE